MPITTDEAVIKYLEERGIHTTGVQRLTGGSANFVWRVQLKEKRADLGDQPTIVVKHAESFVAFDVNLFFDAARMNFEIEALRLANDPAISVPKMGVPSVYSYDAENNVAFMEDVVGSATVKAYISDLAEPPSPELSHEIGSLLAQFIARLHNYGLANRDVLRGKFDHRLGADLSKAYFYDRAEGLMRSFGIESPDAVAAAAYGGEQLVTNPQTFCMGDYWTGNVLINVGSTEGVKLRVVDWEVCRYAPSGMDVGQMLAELFCLHTFRHPCEDLMKSFLQVYAKEFHPTLYDVKIAIIQFGLHLLIWTPTAGWTDDGASIARIGIDYVSHAWQEDWPWFENTVFREYLHNPRVKSCVVQPTPDPKYLVWGNANDINTAIGPANTWPHLTILYKKPPKKNKQENDNMVHSESKQDIINCNSIGCCVPLPLDVNPYEHSYNATTVVAKSMLDRLAKRATLLSTNILNVATDLVNYFHEPKKPSWDISTTLLSSLLQALVSHGQLGELDIVRFFTSIPTIPPPFMSKIQEVRFRVGPRDLPGMLRPLDKVETGDREILAEWVMDRSLASMEQMLPSKTDSFVVKVEENSSPRVILYAHGGAMVLMSSKTHRLLTWCVSKSTGLPIFSINYRLAPEHPFPAGLHDVVLSFLHLIDKEEGYGYDPANVMVMGDSAGGGLMLSMMLYLRDHGLPLPGAAALFSPWVDLSMSHDSWSNRKYDYLPLLTEDHPIHATKMYLGEERYPYMLKHPYVSPVFAQNFDNLPPILLQAGGCECLHDEIQELATRIAQSNTYVQLEVYEDMIHVFQAFPFLKASRKALQSVGWWSMYAVNIIHKWQHEVTTLRRELELAKSTD